MYLLKKCEFDNMGKYDNKPARSRKKNRWAVNIVSICEAYCFLEDGKKCLQANEKLAPMNWMDFDIRNLLTIKNFVKSWETNPHTPSYTAASLSHKHTQTHTNTCTYVKLYILPAPNTHRDTSRAY